MPRIEELMGANSAAYEVEGPGLVRVEYGPVSMSIRAETNGQPNTAAAVAGAQEAVALLDGLARFKYTAALPIRQVQASQDYPPVLNRMIMAAKSTTDSTVTPMVAVAGTMAELVSEAVIEHHGATTVIVDNGGDIAIRTNHGRAVRVGVALDVFSKKVTHLIPVDHWSGIGGICTSGLGGRSFTKGVATAAVAIGKSASVADACATLIGNATLVRDPAVEQDYAEKIDPLIDIAGHLVTTKVGRLSPESVIQALEGGINKGKEFIDKGLILGVIVVVQDKIRMYPEGIAVPR